VGVAFPLVRVQLSPSITSTIDRISTCPDPSSPTCNKLVHSWDGLGQTTKTQSLSGSAAGLGDIILRTKYRFLDVAKGGIAAGVDVRVPSGDKENLLGTGAVQTKVQLIASGEFSRVAPHFNLGYTYSHGDISSSLTTLPTAPEPANAATQSQINAVNGLSIGGDLRLPNEVSYTGGIDFAAHPLLTISGDLIGRTLLGVQRFSTVSQTYQYRISNGGPLLSTSRDTFTSTGETGLNLLLGVVSAKYNIPGTPFLVTGSVLFPLTDAGLRPNVTPVVGVDYSFKK
jgi:hypothetical protein